MELESIPCLFELRGRGCCGMIHIGCTKQPHETEQEKCDERKQNRAY